MDMYGDTFKLQDMLDSDIRSDLDVLLTCNGDLEDDQEDHQHTLTDLAPAVPLESLDMDSAVGEVAASTWLSQGSQLFNLGSDFDIPGGLLVNPQTGVPITMPQPPTAVPARASENQTFCTSQRIDGLPSESQLITSSSSPSPQHLNHAAVQISLEQPSTITAVISSPKSKQKFSSGKNSKSDLQQNNREKSYPKPAFSYSCLIAMALKNSRTGSLPVNEIYNFMIENFPYFKTAPHGWKNSVRHNLSLNKWFEKIEKPVSGDKNQRKVCLWAMNPAKINKLDEEVQKWSRKDPLAIRRSMAKPERLELLEKGHLKDVYPIEAQEYGTTICHPLEQSMDVTSNSNEIQDNTVTTGTQTDHSGGHLAPVECLDPLLSEVDLQKGIWENLGEDRMQLLVNSQNVSPLIFHSTGQTVTLGTDESTIPAFSCTGYIITQASGPGSYSLHCPYPNEDNQETTAITNNR
ncbi:forkhead box protein O-like [Limulus polyphemus]|uniref:Forkhead box protein O-like n=1 Tax=Limulus polyphemus TaxID=6850 RepID=A0ABM1BPK1_LIMPO|nr:forkhead box protein O-like [Limulus polyphemus]